MGIHSNELKGVTFTLLKSLLRGGTLERGPCALCRILVTSLSACTGWACVSQIWQRSDQGWRRYAYMAKHTDIYVVMYLQYCDHTTTTLINLLLLMFLRLSLFKAPIIILNFWNHNFFEVLMCNISHYTCRSLLCLVAILSFRLLSCGHF